MFGLLDLSILMLLFLPFYAEKFGGNIQSVPLLALNSIQPYLKIIYYVVVIIAVVVGTITLAFQNCQRRFWLKSKTKISLTLGIILVLLFMISLQVYASVFAFVILVIKTLMLIKL